ncbi:TIGR04255 family protein [Chromohalobacter japonicus]|uniref:TIGR04255 family protein n=1 Tax=Chromohalobacter japonicus TaxID=223900 RepID=UPI0015CF6FDA|nr:TIGR04255 family protein [Chromohalobacter japonicus]
MRLSQAPLIHVVAQVHFSELPAYDESSLKQLHQSLIEAGYPERVDSQMEEVELSLEVPDKGGAKHRSRHVPRFLFKGPGQLRLIELRHDCLLFKVTDYPGHDAFLAEWSKVMRLVTAALPDLTKALLHRLSLRYVDLVVPKEGETLRELVSDSLMPPPLPDVDGRALFGSTLKVLDTGKGRHFRVTFEEIQPQDNRLSKVLPDDLIERAPDCGLNISALPHWQTVTEPYGMLDINHLYIASDTPAVGAIDMSIVFRELYEQTHRAFWNLITDQAIESWS